MSLINLGVYVLLNSLLNLMFKVTVIKKILVFVIFTCIFTCGIYSQFSSIQDNAVAIRLNSDKIQKYNNIKENINAPSCARFYHDNSKYFVLNIDKPNLYTINLSNFSDKNNSLGMALYSKKSLNEYVKIKCQTYYGENAVLSHRFNESDFQNGDIILRIWFNQVKSNESIKLDLYKRSLNKNVANKTSTFSRSGDCEILQTYPDDVCYHEVVMIDELCCEIWDPYCQQIYNECFNDETKNTLTVTTSQYTAQQLVQDILVSGCVEAYNVQYTGHPSALGYFDNAEHLIGVQDGIIISTGRATDAVGPNSSNATSSNLGRPGNPILTEIAGGTTYDAAVLEFNFVPATEEVMFNYVFGSDEYPQFAPPNHSDYNDVFAFLISGGPEDYDNYNVALIPGTTTPVSINNVNAVTNTDYYISNRDPIVYNFEYDGFTVPLTAYADVTACEEYSIKLAIADVGDGLYDSAVFIEAGSFVSGEAYTIQSFNVYGEDVAVMQGCSNYIIFERDADHIPMSQPIPVEISFSGSAVMGEDYSSIPTEFDIPPFEDYLRVDFDAYVTGNTDNTNIIITIENGCPCDEEANIHEIIIEPPFEISPVISNTGPICEGQTANVNLQPNAQDPSIISIEWSTGDLNVNSISVNPSETTEYSVTVTYPCDDVVLNSTVEVNYELTPDFNDYGPYCVGQSAGQLPATSNNDVQGTWTPSHNISTASDGLFYYTFTPNIGECAEPVTLTIIVNENITPDFSEFSNYCQNYEADELPTISENEPPINGYWEPQTINTSEVGTFTYTFFPIDEGCYLNKEVDITIIEQPQLEISIEEPILCYGDQAYVIVEPVGGEEPYSGDIGEFYLNAGYHHFILEDNNCRVEESLHLTQPTLLQTSLHSKENQICQTPGRASVLASGGTEPYTFNWPPEADNINDGFALALHEGVYNVTVTDANNCESVETFNILDDGEMEAFAEVVTHVKCYGRKTGEVRFEMHQAKPPYHFVWDDGSDVNYSSVHIVQGFYAGEFEVTVTDNHGCKSINEVTINEPDRLTANYLVNPPSCIGNNDGYIIIDVEGGTEPYTYYWNEFTSNINHIENLYDGSYTIEVVDNNECKINLGTIILREEREACLVIPNAFTPNGDGINDYWVLENIEMYPSAIINVFNRWGQVMYFGRGHGDPWDGKHEGKFVPAGTYLYTIHIDAVKEPITGTVTVVY